MNTGIIGDRIDSRGQKISTPEVEKKEGGSRNEKWLR